MHNIICSNMSKGFDELNFWPKYLQCKADYKSTVTSL